MDSVETRAGSVGRALERLEDDRLLRGQGEFCDDLRVPHMLHAAMVRSPLAHARLRAVDARAALALPGVRAVLTAQDVVAACGAVPLCPLRLQPLESMDPYRQPVIARDEVRYVGEVIAVVVADTQALAEDATELVGVDLEPLPAIIEVRDQASRALTFHATRGDVDAAFAAAVHVQRERFTIQRQSPVTLETRGVLADWQPETGRLVVYGAAKYPFFTRRTCAAMLGMDPSRVDFIEGDTGGSFGARGEFYVEDFLVPFAARHVGRAVKWIEDRRESLLAMAQSRECEADVSMAFAADGTILGVRGDVWCDIGAYPRSNGMVQPRNIAQFLTGPYRIAAVAIDAHVQLTNKGPAGTYRAPGRFETALFCERLLERGSAALGLDSVEVRRRNLLRAPDMPWPFARLDPSAPQSSAVTQTDSGDYRSTFERCLVEFDWAGRRALQGRLIDGRYHGIGITCFVEGGGAGPRENARIELAADGRVHVFVGSTAVGQGLETALTQIAADALGVPLDAIALMHGSTTYLAEGFGTGHSRSTVMGGSAIAAAAAKFKETLREAAAAHLGCAVDALIVDGTQVRWDTHAMSFAELARHVKVNVDGSFLNNHHTYAYGTACAYVAVDARTGAVELLDYLVVEDVGRAVNPLLLHGQVIGGTIQGLGSVFLEDLVYDGAGQLLTGTLADYLVPGATDFPNIRSITLDEYPSPINPLGVKGAGEGGTIAVGAVMLNAIASALASFGVNPTALPLSPARLWEVIGGR